MIATHLPQAKMISISEDTFKKCLWMGSGVVNYKLCDLEYNCEGCLFDRVMRGLEDRTESPLGRGKRRQARGWVVGCEERPTPSAPATTVAAAATPPEEGILLGGRSHATRGDVD